MSDFSYDIESIVRQVLKEIEAGAAKPQAALQVAISSPVVSLEQVEGRLAGIKQLVVPRGAVVTPSVRDLLREKNIALTFSTEKIEKATDGSLGGTQHGEIRHGGARHGGIRLSLTEALVKPSLKFDLAALGRGLQSDGIDVEESTSKCLIETTDRFAALIDDGPALGAVVTSHPAAALCLANRLCGVRAIGPATVEDVTRDAKAVGANLIVINPAGRGVFQIRRMIREFRRNGPHECPSALVDRLK